LRGFFYKKKVKHPSRRREKGGENRQRKRCGHRRKQPGNIGTFAYVEKFEKQPSTVKGTRSQDGQIRLIVEVQKGENEGNIFLSKVGKKAFAAVKFCV